MTYHRTDKFNIYLSETDSSQISSAEKIAAALRDDNVIAFDINDGDVLIGFVMFRKFDENSYFLWNYAIDSRYQNKHYGSKALRELLELMKDNYCAKLITTTYNLGNLHAQHVYEKIGFIETDVVNENDIHEINMEIRL